MKNQKQMYPVAFTLVFVLAVNHCDGSIDEFMSCDRYFETKRTARVLDEIPCDMTKTSFCQYKGSGYPEAAIWRFKEENRALMKRLYGDMESNSVYREMRSANHGGSRLHNLPNEEHSLFSNMEYNIRMGSGLATVKSAKQPIVSPAMAQHRLPMKKKKIVMKKRKKPASSNPQQANQKKIAPGIVQNQSKPPVTPATQSPLVPNPPTTTPNVEPSLPEALPFENAKLGQQSQSNFESTFSDLLSEVGLESLESMVGELLPKEEALQTERAGPQELGEEDLTAPQFADEVYEPIQVDTSPFELEEEELEEEILNDQFDNFDYSGPSVNACPVKEEVFAPYWANNTRDQVLALLNLYPFEQYIHMETCQFEQEQMMCRRGCRCEQQYRLHRLLAFDPNNECRGIFSDWFRFPSYCICKCYNLPEDFVPELRSPKMKNGQRQMKAKEFDETSPDGKIKNIPAVLPYEAKQAILRDIQTSHREDSKQGRSLDVPQEPVESNSVDIEKRTLHVEDGKSDNNQEHFLYGSAPVFEYHLSDGTGGSIKKTPR